MHLAIFFKKKTGNDLLHFFFFFFFARWISVANVCSSHSVSSADLSFISVMTITSSPLSKYPWSGREGNTVINGVEPYPVESWKEKDHCSGLKQLLNVESLSCRELCSDTFPFAFAAQEMHNCTVDYLTLLSSFLVSLKDKAFPSYISEIESQGWMPWSWEAGCIKMEGA